MRTAPHPTLGLTFASHTWHLGNALRDQSPRSEINVAFEQCLLHDAALAHELLAALKELVALLDRSELAPKDAEAAMATADATRRAEAAIAKAEAE